MSPAPQVGGFLRVWKQEMATRAVLGDSAAGKGQGVGHPAKLKTQGSPVTMPAARTLSVKNPTAGTCRNAEGAPGSLASLQNPGPRGAPPSPAHAAPRLPGPVPELSPPGGQGQGKGRIRLTLLLTPHPTRGTAPLVVLPGQRAGPTRRWWAWQPGGVRAAGSEVPHPDLVLAPTHTGLTG